MSASAVRRFEVEHVSEFRYGEAARGSLLTRRLKPRTDATRRLLDFSRHIDPAAAPIPYADAFGNACHLVNLHREHRHTLVRSRSQVEVAQAPESSPLAGSASWEALTESADPVRYWEYLSPSRLAFPCPALEAFTRENGISRERDLLSSLRHAASTLRPAFTYEPGSTEVDSSLEQVLETGRGVCQDYTHVMLAVARSWGIPSRYVSGYVHSDGASGEAAEAGVSHAWAEFLLPGLGWLGLAPTNDTLADLCHIPVAVGRDYVDAVPTRGTVFGGGKSTLEVRVSVVESDRGVQAEPVRTHGPVLTAPRSRAAGTECHLGPVRRRERTRTFANPSVSSCSIVQRLRFSTNV